MQSCVLLAATALVKCWHGPRRTINDVKLSNVETELFYGSALFDTRGAQSCLNTIHTCKILFFTSQKHVFVLKRHNWARADNKCNFWNKYKESLLVIKMLLNSLNQQITTDSRTQCVHISVYALHCDHYYGYYPISH